MKVSTHSSSLALASLITTSLLRSASTIVLLSIYLSISSPLPTLSHLLLRYDTMLGEWKDGKMNGMGIYRGVDGDLYEGNNNTSSPSHLQ